MLGTFLDEARELLGRRYLLTAWAPTFVVVCLAATVPLTSIGWGRSAAWWSDLGGVAQAAAGLLALLLVAAAAYVLQSLPVVRVFEGYALPRSLRTMGRWSEAARWQRLKDRERAEWYSTMPKRREDLMPTRLGNVLVAAETYPKAVYNMDGVFWWPRLAPSIPAEFRTTIDEALFPVVALLNAATLLAVASVASLVWLLLAGAPAVALVSIYLVGIVLSVGAYRTAVSQARSYGEWVRAAFDLYRHQLWAQLRLAPPADSAEEWRTWTQLEDWTYNFNPRTGSGEVPEPPNPVPYVHRSTVPAEGGAAPAPPADTGAAPTSPVNAGAHSAAPADTGAAPAAPTPEPGPEAGA